MSGCCASCGFVFRSVCLFVLLVLECCFLSFIAAPQVEIPKEFALPQEIPRVDPAGGPVPGPVADGCVGSARGRVVGDPWEQLPTPSGSGRADPPAPPPGVPIASLVALPCGLCALFDIGIDRDAAGPVQSLTATVVLPPSGCKPVRQRID